MSWGLPAQMHQKLADVPIRNDDGYNDLTLASLFDFIQSNSDYENGYTKKRPSDELKKESYKYCNFPNICGVMGVNKDGSVAMRQLQDNRTLEQIINDLMKKDVEQQNEINFLKQQLKILSDRMVILYKEFKRFGNSVELFE